MSEINLRKIERKWLTYWEKEKIYKFNENSKKEIYSIDTPPPTVSGDMHIGHAFSYAQEDFIARYKRMRGFEVFYPFGTDDNGLPTERLVEKLKNVKSKSMSRTKFVELCLKTLKEIAPKFVQDWKDLGVSCDYEISYSTINKFCQKISQASFIELYKKGAIYKKEFPTVYCVECQTPIAQAELEDKEKETQFVTLRFKVDGKDLPIATTRPELLGACVAIFVNPRDKRYKNLIGQSAKVPLFNYNVPIIADDSASIDKGTGALMVCSYGDKYDVDAINKHKLEPKIIFDKNGTLKIKDYEGMKIKEAKRKILEYLDSANLIIEQKTIIHNVNVHDKCQTEIEFLPTEQWFVAILNKKKELISQGRKIKWHPDYMFKRYENWIKGLAWDWSISRERYFGVPIPAWYCKNCDETILANEKELPVDPLQAKKICEKCKKYAEPDEKVLDTWATSSLTPQIASALVNEKVKIPYSLRPQAHDIIRTWAFYTIVKSFYHEKSIPWKDIAISGFITLEGEKMSKSKGNVIAPRNVMENYGADGLRYWAAGSKLGENLVYQEKDLIAGKKFIIKILNAANFVFLNLKHQTKQPKLIETDRLFFGQLNRLVDNVTDAFEEYSYTRTKLETDQFFWKIFANNYLEIVKKRVYDGTNEEKASAFYTLYHTLLTILKLFAPITPYICEEIYQQHFKKYEKEKSIHLMVWPEKIKIKESKDDDQIFERLFEIVAGVRQLKSKAKKAMNAEIILTLEKRDMQILKNVLSDLKAVSAAGEIKEGKFRVEFL